ncbi:potassium channel family protein [Reichenbachiella agarivorans]|uniref:Potassium channel family protein n=1 Tax=Reichenbachiella agarivorans TaxID=2979464 RepID=A0ABY6CNM5_9BACT|nr:potassium channel family protein [Reichenbachiella agarivorans]UXP32126.1 potassium channel family protein [Reichenbachiella agarivorans]
MNFFKKHKERFFIKYRYIILFVVMMGKLFFPSILNSNFGDGIISPILDVMLFAASMLIVQKLKKAVIAIGVIGGIGLLINIFGGETEVVGLLIFSLFIAIVTYELFSDLIGKKSIEFNEIMGAMDGYVLIGYIGSLMMLLIHVLYPEAFLNVGDDEKSIQDLVYFSYVTMLTIGYGDIVPVSPAARSMVVVLGLIGQFYLVVVIATFVGKFLMGEQRKED